jgi:hypothetical protein
VRKEVDTPALDHDGFAVCPVGLRPLRRRVCAGVASGETVPKLRRCREKYAEDHPVAPQSDARTKVWGGTFLNHPALHTTSSRTTPTGLAPSPPAPFFTK